MEETINNIFAPGKGILALDWSPSTITKQFQKVGLTSTPELNRIYRQMLVTSPGLSEFIGGVILHDETVNQKKDSGETFMEFLDGLGIVSGVRADQGSEKYKDTDQDMTKGLEGIGERLKTYREMGIKFTKWRSGFKISDLYPSKEFIEDSVTALSEFAKISQAHDLVPLVEPDVEMHGRHTTTRCSEITVDVLNALFEKLKSSEVDLTRIILKTNMVLPGMDSGVKAMPFEVAQFTLRAMNRTVPGEVPGIVFLSGGQTPDQACANLNEIMKQKSSESSDTGPSPWKMSFSFARALQEEALAVWSGKSENIEAAQKALLDRLSITSKAVQGTLE